MSITVAEWVALVFSGFAIIVSIRAYWVSRKALSISETEHGWKAAERVRESARERWCEEQLERLNAVAREYAIIEVPDQFRPWATWGHGCYFTVKTDEAGVMRIFKLGT